MYDNTRLDAANDEVRRLNDELRQKDMDLARKDGELQTMLRLWTQTVRAPKDIPEKPRANSKLKTFATAIDSPPEDKMLSRGELETKDGHNG